MAGDFIPFGPESLMWRINRERAAPQYLRVIHVEGKGKT
jgi:hypothetical protein